MIFHISIYDHLREAFGLKAILPNCAQLIESIYNGFTSLGVLKEKGFIPKSLVSWSKMGTRNSGQVRNEVSAHVGVPL